MHTIEYSGKYNFVYYQFFENLTAQEIIDVFKKIADRTSDWNEIFLLSDYRRPISGTLDAAGVYKMADYVNDVFHKEFEFIKWGNLTRVPRQTAAAALFSRLITAKNIDYKQFTTADAALKWLNIHPDNLLSGRMLELISQGSGDFY